MTDQMDGEDEDENAWRTAVRDVKPLRPEPPKAPARHKPPAPTLRETHTPPPVAPKPQVTKDAGAGLDRRTAEKLRRGKMPIEARLDLHGYTKARAYEALVRFIIEGYGAGLRCVLVITGKGGGGLRDPLSPGAGILRTSVPEWLGEPAFRGMILKTAPARPEHGGDGALYVLLRRNR